MLVLNFLRQYPIPTAGLILSLFALGNLVQGYSQRARLLLGGVAFLLYLPYLLKLLVLNAKLKEPLENPVAASVLPTCLLNSGLAISKRSAASLYFSFLPSIPHSLP